MNKTCLYSLSYLDGVDASGSSRLERQIKYINYYKDLKSELGFQAFVFYDNASSEVNLATFLKEIPEHEPIEIHCAKVHLARGENYEYPYAWRGLHFIRNLILKGYEKIICIDSDTFVLSKRLAEHIKNCNTGWQAFWSAKYQWPTAELHILNKDKFEFFMGYTSTRWNILNGQCQEDTLPFSHVNKTFYGDRFGESKIPQQPEHEYYSQCPVNIAMEFEK